MANIVSQYLGWHFHDAPKGILKAFGNFLVFNFNYFSIGLLAQTLFNHWRRYRESYGRGFDIKRYLSAFIFNLMSRVLGAIVRTVVIIVGLVAELFIFIGAVIVLLTWIVLPVLLLLGLYFGLKLLI